MARNADSVVKRQARVIRMLTCLQRGPGLNADELAIRLEVSRRTVFRDLNLLRDAGIAVHFDKEESAYRVQHAMEGTLIPPMFNIQDLLHLTLAAQASMLNSFAPLRTAIREAIARLLANYTGDVSESITRLLNACCVQLPPQQPNANQMKILYKLFEAIRRRRRVRLVYWECEFEEPRETQLCPYRLIMAVEPWQVEGRSSYHRRNQAFPIDQIRSVSITTDEFVIPWGYRFRDISD